MKAAKRPPPAWLSLASTINVLIACMLLGRVAQAQEETILLELSLLNGVWVDMVQDLAPIKRGPLKVTVSSPHHRIAVHRNQLRLAPQGDGRIAAYFEVELEGEGELIADIKAGVSQRIEDEVTVPRQTLRLTGVIRLSKDTDGFRITLLELPPEIEIRIESRMLGRLVQACKGLGSFLPIDCEGFGRDLQTARIPSPEPGESVLLPFTYLTEEERAIFAGFAQRPGD